MALLMMDGFDKYGVVGTPNSVVLSLLAGDWTSAQAGTLAIVAPLSANGQALFTNSTGGYVSKTVANTARFIGGVRLSSNLAGTNSGTGIAFFDTSSAQFCIDINPSGQILLRSGGSSGTILATGSTTISANSVHYLEWDVTVSTTGAYQVWLDGVSIISGTGNTRAGSTNNYANMVRLGNFAGTSAQAATVDDFYLFDGTGTTNNAVLLTNPVVETQFPNSDLAIQLTSGAVTLGQNYSTTATTNAPGANELFLRNFTPAVNMTLNSVSCVPKATSGTAKFKPILVTTPVAAVTAHRYWRVNILATGGSNPSLNEIEFRTTAGTSRSFSGGTAAASTVQGANSAANATDGNTANGWIAGNSTPPGWWSYDYGVGNSLTVAEVWIYASTTTAQCPTSFDLQWSDDNLTWNTVANFTQVWATNSESHTWQVSSRPTTPGSPGSTIVTGTEVVGATTGVTLTGVFASGQTLTGGVQYGIGFVTDTSVVLQQVDTGTAGQKYAVTYSVAPSTLPTMTAGQASWQIWGNCTGAASNYPAVNNNPPYDDGAYVSSSTPGVKDLYTFPVLSDNPTAVHCVSVKARAKRTDSGTRTVSLHADSGATDSTGSAPGQTPGSSYGWMDSAYPLDPNTGAAWTGTGVNGMSGGIGIVS